MILLKRNGKTYEIDHHDAERIRALTFSNGGDLLAATKKVFEDKYGEPLEPRPETPQSSPAPSPGTP